MVNFPKKKKKNLNNSEFKKKKEKEGNSYVNLFISWGKNGNSSRA